MYLTEEQHSALAIAHSLVELGIPIFVARADTSRSLGFALPRGWQQTVPRHELVDAWMPGDALCLVTGHGLDLLDVDPRNDGSASFQQLTGSLPNAYGVASTPSGGMHAFISSLRLPSSNNVLPGIDVKGGTTEGDGLGIAFIAPTVRASKETGQPTPYRWVTAPDSAQVASLIGGALVDTSGTALAALIEQQRAPRTPAAEPYAGPSYSDLPDDQRASIDAYTDATVRGICEDLDAAQDWAAGQTDDRGRGWERLCADAAWRLGRLARASWCPLDLAEAQAAFIEHAPTDETWMLDDVARKWSEQCGRGEPMPLPELDGGSQREAEAWERFELQPAAASPPGGAPPGELSAPVAAPPTRQLVGSYFGEGGLQAVSLAHDVALLGPLRVGVDDVMWHYADGVWRSRKNVVRDRVVQLLGEKFRPSFASTAESVVRSLSGSITCEPVAEVINFRNGLLDWRTGELKPHTPDVLTTIQLDTEYVPDAACPSFDAFLAQVVPPDAIELVWELIGYLMYSGNPLHKAVMLAGSGRNGKGTFLRVIGTLLGRRNTTAVSLHDLINIRFAKASLFGKTANIAGDIDASYLDNTATFKAITGGDQISAEHKGRDSFEFTPWAVPVFSANKIPPSADTSVGYLDRWLVVPFPNSFSGREDRGLDARLQTPGELQGIAAKGVAHLAQLLERGDFELTESMREARVEFERRVDQVRTWLADCAELDPDAREPRKDLYEAYSRWADRDGHRRVKAGEFYDRLESVGARQVKVRGDRYFAGLRLIDAGYVSMKLPSGFLPHAPGQGADASGSAVPPAVGTRGQAAIQPASTTAAAL